MATVVTATQSGVTANGLILRVRCVTGADTLANIAAGTGKGTQTGAAAHQVALTTTRIGSVVWCAMENANAGANNPSAGNSSLDDVPDATNGQQYGTIFQTTPTVTPGAFTSGSADSFGGGAASLEILPVISGGTIAYDSSGPAVASTLAATTIATASFTPPPGALLMAVVSSNGGAGVVNMTVSDGVLTWTEVVAAHATSQKYAGIWLAQVPAASGSAPLLIRRPGKTWLRRFKHRQATPPPITELDLAVTGLVSDNPTSSNVGTVGIGAVGLASNTASASNVGTVATGTIGQVSNSTSASPVGVPAISVTGVASNTTSVSNVGTIASGAIGIASNATSASPVGTPKIAVTGIISNTTSASLVGTVNLSTFVTGITSNTTSASPVGTVGTGTIGQPSNTTSASLVGTAKIAITGVASNTLTASPIGTVTGSAPVTGVTSHVTSASNVGTVAVKPIGLVSNTTSASLVGTAKIAITGLVSNTVSASPVGSVSVFTPRDPEQFSAIITDANTLGAVVTGNTFGTGSLVVGPWGGIVSRFTLDGIGGVLDHHYGGTVADANLFGGTVTDANLFGGTQIGFTMQAQNITLGEFNDELLNITVQQSGSAFNLTGFTLKAYLKTAAGVSDTDPSTITLSSTGGSPAITVISAPAGTIQIRIARADITPTVGFWRLDVIDGSSNQNTVVQGTVTVTLL